MDWADMKVENSWEEALKLTPTCAYKVSHQYMDSDPVYYPCRAPGVQETSEGWRCEQHKIDIRIPDPKKASAIRMCAGCWTPQGCAPGFCAGPKPYWQP
jgi:hypothetical protein